MLLRGERRFANASDLVIAPAHGEVEVYPTASPDPAAVVVPVGVVNARRLPLPGGRDRFYNGPVLNARAPAAAGFPARVAAGQVGTRAGSLLREGEHWNP
jgi:hypothetical protein